ncbi:NAD-dependent epimerase/dehydratase family protein [Polymorphospora lycopeni]|uniref:NAD-dependent epimerase/dehydratase family protein n=1 Tax=Polymorphospora lycopeni TaxID=3140240 RepID=A0ABV5CKC4_9ACTN
MKVVVAGGSGALGRRLCADLAARGHEVVVLTRRPRGGPHRQVAWDGATVGDWAGELAGSAVVNLAGELVDRRPTAANVELLTRSRVAPTRALADAARRLEQPVPVWIQASTLAIYGDAGEQLLTEESPEADGPPQMAGVARAWEAAAVDVPARRRVVLRTSIVLDRDTPALDRLTGLVRFGLGGRVGTGRQWFSWIHVDDSTAHAAVTARTGSVNSPNGSSSATGSTWLDSPRANCTTSAVPASTPAIEARTSRLLRNLPSR